MQRQRGITIFTIFLIILNLSTLIREAKGDLTSCGKQVPNVALVAYNLYSPSYSISYFSLSEEKVISTVNFNSQISYLNYYTQVSNTLLGTYIYCTGAEAVVVEFPLYFNSSASSESLSARDVSFQVKDNSFYIGNCGTMKTCYSTSLNRLIMEVQINNTFYDGIIYFNPITGQVEEGIQQRGLTSFTSCCVDEDALDIWFFSTSHFTTYSIGSNTPISSSLISICPQNDCNIYGTPFYVSDHQILLWLNFPHNQTNELVYVSYSQNKLTLTNKYSLPWNVGTITAYFKSTSAYDRVSGMFTAMYQNQTSSSYAIIAVDTCSWSQIGQPKVFTLEIGAILETIATPPII